MVTLFFYHKLRVIEVVLPFISHSYAYMDKNISIFFNLQKKKISFFYMLKEIIMKFEQPIP